MNTHNKAHNLAKLALFAVQSSLTLCIVLGFLSSWSVFVLCIAFLLKELLYYFGTNTVAFFVETVLGYNHEHDKI